MKIDRSHLLGFLLAACLLLSMVAMNALEADGEEIWNGSPCSRDDGPIVMRVVMIEDTAGDPQAAGKTAAQKLLTAMGTTPLKAVILSECFEDWEYKQPMLKGVCDVIAAELVFGGATYGSFTQSGCTDLDAVSLIGIGGEGVGITAALTEKLGVSKLTFEEHEEQIKDRLHRAGRVLAANVPRTDQDRLAILIADAHSPKNQYLVEGMQGVLGKQFPITGGSANKNAGQTYVYYQGKAYQDSALVLMLSGKFGVSLTGRKAMNNDAVISSARDGAKEALARAEGDPIAVFAFNCAGRRGKLRDPVDELTAMQTVMGDQVPLFGCYCAGEVGPLDVEEKPSDALSGGGGWHVMFTVLSR
jgi:hypothetical protein